MILNHLKSIYTLSGTGITGGIVVLNDLNYPTIVSKIASSEARALGLLKAALQWVNIFSKLFFI